MVLYPNSEPEDIARAINAAILSADLPMFTITPHDLLLPDELMLYDTDDSGEMSATSDTGTFFDHISIGHFKSTYDLSRFKMLMCNHCTEQDRAGPVFQGLAETIVATLTNDPGEDKQKAQAAMVIVLIGSTRPPYTMRQYCAPDAAATEIVLMGRPAAERFAPLLEAKWQHFTELRALWPGVLTEHGIGDRVQALAAGLALEGASSPTLRRTPPSPTCARPSSRT